jgi:hypothetical protein
MFPILTYVAHFFQDCPHWPVSGSESRWFRFDDQTTSEMVQIRLIVRVRMYEYSQPIPGGMVFSHLA